MEPLYKGHAGTMNGVLYSKVKKVLAPNRTSAQVSSFGVTFIRHSAFSRYYNSFSTSVQYLVTYSKVRNFLRETFYCTSVKTLLKLLLFQISGIGKVTESMLNALSVTTCGDLYQQRAVLQLLFSQSSSSHFLRVCLGLGSTHVHRSVYLLITPYC